MKMKSNYSTKLNCLTTFCSGSRTQTQTVYANVWSTFLFPSFTSHVLLYDKLCAYSLFILQIKDKEKNRANDCRTVAAAQFTIVGKH